MVRTTRDQRRALFRVFQRDFPGWLSPNTRKDVASYCKSGFHGGEPVKVPTIQWRRFRASVMPGPGCVMVKWRGMWLGVEPDGYTHS